MIESRARPWRSGEVAQQHQRRAVGPLEIVDHDQHRRRRRELAEQPDDGLEQPVALGLGVALLGRRELGQPPAQLRHQTRELGAMGVNVRAQLVQRRAPRRSGPAPPETAGRRPASPPGRGRRARACRSRAPAPRPRPAAASCRRPGRRPAAAAARCARRARTRDRRPAATARAPRARRRDPTIVGAARCPQLRGQRDRLRDRVWTFVAVSDRGRLRQRHLSRRRARPPCRPGAAAPGARRSRRPTGRCPSSSRSSVRKPLEHAQRLGDVALRLERLHQQDVARLAVGLGVDQRPRRALRPSRAGHLPSPARRARPPPARAAACRTARAGGCSSQTACAPGSSPRLAMLSGTCASAQARRGSPACSAASARSTCDRRRLDVDPRRLGQLEHQLVATDEDRLARAPSAAATAASAAPRPAICGALLGPQRADQLLATDRAVPVEHQVGEQQRHLLAAQRTDEFDAVDLDGQPATELDPMSLACSRLRWQRFGNVSPTAVRKLSEPWSPGPHGTTSKWPSE